MASSEWPDNVERGPTSNEFVKRPDDCDPKNSRRPPRALMELGHACEGRLAHTLSRRGQKKRTREGPEVMRHPTKWGQTAGGLEVNLTP